ncbi:hypothetical protein Acsp07_35740 [Actinomycetospora sp. NBRC 106378]|nr:hypothetical protein Acsp07_35740 [Actinomycetospora sp. NBRC 106378]
MRPASATPLHDDAPFLPLDDSNDAFLPRGRGPLRESADRVRETDGARGDGSLAFTGYSHRVSCPHPEVNR